MSWVHFVEKRDERSTAARTRFKSERRVSICVLAVIVVLFVGYVISLAFRSDRTSPALPPSRGPVENSIAGIAGTELLSTRLNTGLPQEPSPFRFAEIAQQAGIDFVHFSGMTEERYSPTANGSGVAIFDYDNDGKLDLYFATGTLLPLGTAGMGPIGSTRTWAATAFRK